MLHIFNMLLAGRMLRRVNNAFFRRGTGCLRFCLAICIVAWLAGCESTRWIVPRPVETARRSLCGHHRAKQARCQPSSLLDAELAYKQAADAEFRDLPCCVDHYYRAVASSWLCLSPHLREEMPRCKNFFRAWELYHSSLFKLLETAQRFGRFDPANGLAIHGEYGHRIVTLKRHGFPWQAEDFSKLIPVGKYETRDLSHIYGQDGLGVPLVVMRIRAEEDRFMTQGIPFAATAVYRSDSHGDGPVIEFHNPNTVDELTVDGTNIKLAADNSAAYALIMTASDRSWFREFVRPRRSQVSNKLIMLEPYQPGKIPLVFVHGLLSDPLTWVNVLNELQARPDIAERYQVWAFRYATGKPFLAAARDMRRELRAAIETSDPTGEDAALRNVILVGHSMGGLVSKLLVTESGTTMWDAIATRPFESIDVTPQERRDLRATLFFRPEPDVSRVVFIGTPHCGSVEAQSLLGRLGSSLVELPRQDQNEYEDIIRRNPGLVTPAMQDGIPTSVDLLEPDNPMLAALRELPINQNVTLHSIIGDGGCQMPCRGPTDGAVAVASARHPGVASEKMVDAKHTELHYHEEGVKELVRILRVHAAGSRKSASPSVVERW